VDGVTSSDPLRASGAPVEYRILFAAGEQEAWSDDVDVDAMLSGAPAVSQRPTNTLYRVTVCCH